MGECKTCGGRKTIFKGSPPEPHPCPDCNWPSDRVYEPFPGAFGEAGAEKPDDGGPAFPETWPNQAPRPGMTLRDWFAGQAVAGGVPAHRAYECADAMLAARKR